MHGTVLTIHVCKSEFIIEVMDFNVIVVQISYLWFVCVFCLSLSNIYIFLSLRSFSTHILKPWDVVCVVCVETL